MRDALVEGGDDDDDDARARAQRQAELLGVSLGAVIASTDSVATSGSLFFDPYGRGSDACAPFAPGSGYYEPGVGVTVPVFDPTAPTDTEVYARVSLTFAIASAVATPTATATGVAVTISAPTATAEVVIDTEPTPTVPIAPESMPIAGVFAPTHRSNAQFSTGRHGNGNQRASGTVRASRSAAIGRGLGSPRRAC